MKTYWGVDVWIHVFLTSALVGDTGKILAIIQTTIIQFNSFIRVLDNNYMLNYGQALHNKQGQNNKSLTKIMMIIRRLSHIQIHSYSYLMYLLEIYVHRHGLHHYLYKTTVR
jgi:hypothetical protein